MASAILIIFITALLRVSVCDGIDTDNADQEKTKYDVFLGGSCNPTTWRKDTAIPTLNRLGISYYNPQVDDWYPELVAEENKAKETARVLLFVIDDKTRNCVSMIEAAVLASTRPNSLIIVTYSYKKGQTISDEIITDQEYNELKNGLMVLEYLMNRQKIRIFKDLKDALESVPEIIKKADNDQETGIKSSDWANYIISNDKTMDLYIGVVGEDSKWLESSAVPSVKSRGLTLYSPSTNEYSDQVLPSELEHMMNSRLIMLVVSQNTRGMAIMTLAAHLIGLRANLVLCIQDIPKGSSVSGEKLTELATKDYNRGRTYLKDMAKGESVPVYDNKDSALQYALNEVATRKRSQVAPRMANTGHLGSPHHLVINTHYQLTMNLSVYS